MPDQLSPHSAYISTFPESVRLVLEQVRAAIREAAPDAVEVISYGMPAFKQKRVLVYYAAHKNHIGFYPTPSGIEQFKTRLAGYKTSRGAIQFPLDKPMPLDLIKEIVRFRVEEDHPSTKRST